MGRAQISLELFFALTLFALLLYWLNFFAETTKNSGTSLSSQEKLLANDLVELANQACASNASIETRLPCLSDKGERIDYVLTSKENRLLVSSRGGGGSVEKTALCAFDNVSIQATCAGAGGAGESEDAGAACVSKTSAATANITWGGCVR